MPKTSKSTATKREKAELQRAVNALQATQHNPVEWTPIIRFIAPIIARIAARYVLSTIGRKLNKRISSKLREETVIGAADNIAELAIKRTRKLPVK